MNKVIKICLVAAALAFAAGCSTQKTPNANLAPDSSVSNVTNNVDAGTLPKKHCKKHCRHGKCWRRCHHKDKLGAPEAPAKDTNK